MPSRDVEIKRHRGPNGWVQETQPVSKSRAQYLAELRNYRNQPRSLVSPDPHFRPTLIIALSCLDFLALLLIESISAWIEFGGDKWHLLMPLGTARFWGCAAVFLVSTGLLMIYVKARRFNRKPWLYWILKDLAAGNAIGFHFWFNSLDPADQTTCLHATGHVLCRLLAVGLRLILWLFKCAGFLLLLSYRFLVSAIFLLCTGIYLARWILVLAVILSILWIMHLNILRSNESVASVTARSHKRLAREFQSASNKMAAEFNENTNTIARALREHGNQIQDASRNIRKGLHGASREVSSALDRTATSVEKAVQGQNRHIDAAARNLLRGIGSAAEYESNAIARALEYRERPAIRFIEDVDSINNGINAVNGLANVANTALQLVTQCNVM
jgi:hypothetical protein